MKEPTMFFKDRCEAAKQLVEKLEKYRHDKCVVLAVPGGGVPIGYCIAKEFNFPLDLLMVKKLGHPFNPEYAIGAVSTETEILEDLLHVPEGYVEKETRRIRQQLKTRYRKYMGAKEAVNLENKTVIILDDGIATGCTLSVSLKMLRNKKPKSIVLAVPVAPFESARKLKGLSDDFICLHTPTPFYGVSTFYTDFGEITDAEIISLLAELNARGITA